MTGDTFKEAVREAVRNRPATVSLSKIAKETGIDKGRLGQYLSRGHMGTDGIFILYQWAVKNGLMQPCAPPDANGLPAIDTNVLLFNKSGQTLREPRSPYGDPQRTVNLPSADMIESAMRDARKTKNKKHINALHEIHEHILSMQDEIDAIEHRFTQLARDIHHEIIRPPETQPNDY